MNDLFKKVSYLEGLADGLGVDETTNEGKLLLQIINVLGDFTDVLEDIVDDQIGLEEYVSFIDEDLSDVEDEIYDDYDEFDDYEDYDDFDDYDDFEIEDESSDSSDDSETFIGE